MTNLIIERTEIHRDDAGRYAIADLHRAAGGGAQHRPRLFLESPAFQAMQRELEAETSSGVPALAGPDDDLMVVAEVAYGYAAWVSARFALRLIRAYDRDVRSHGKPIPTLVELEPEFAAACRLAERFGMRGNQALLSASRAVRISTGIDPTALLGVEGLVVEDGQRHFTPTELGVQLGVSGRRFNVMLADAGLQERQNGEWTPTPAGTPFAVLVDVAKQHSDGAPVQQLRWTAAVLEVFRTRSLNVQSVGMSLVAPAAA